MSSDHSSGLLLGFHLEQAFALVGRTSLDPLPLVDEVLSLQCGDRLREVDVGAMRWSNPGPRHSIRLATRNGLNGLYEAREIFSAGAAALRDAAAQVEGRLLPTGMHPWMEAERAQCWPHGGDTKDQALIALGGKARHGWANQQGLRVSIPFAGEASFRETFACLRFLSPLLPALAAASPFVEGNPGPALNCRIAAGRDFLDGPSLMPRAYSSKGAYENELIVPGRERIRSLGVKLAPLDLCGHLLRADFAAQLIHIDVMDAQESLEADLALCAFTAAATGWLWHSTSAPRDPWPSPRLADLLEVSLVSAEAGIIGDRDYLDIMGYPERGACRYSELLQFLLEDRLAADPAVASCAESLAHMRRASLANRMLARLRQDGETFGPEELFNLYREIVACSENNTMLAAS